MEDTSDRPLWSQSLSASALNVERGLVSSPPPPPPLNLWVLSLYTLLVPPILRSVVCFEGGKKRQVQQEVQQPQQPRTNKERVVERGEQWNPTSFDLSDHISTEPAVLRGSLRWGEFYRAVEPWPQPAQIRKNEFCFKRVTQVFFSFVTTYFFPEWQRCLLNGRSLDLESLRFGSSNASFMLNFFLFRPSLPFMCNTTCGTWWWNCNNTRFLTNEWPARQLTTSLSSPHITCKEI